MFVASKIFCDGEMTYNKAKPVGPGVGAQIARDAARGGSSRSSYQTRLFRRENDDAIYDPEGQKWVPLW